MAFSFSFSGDDIDIDTTQTPEEPSLQHHSQAAETGTLNRSPSTTSNINNTAFPVPGQPLLPAQIHSLSDLLSKLPSSISYGTLRVELDGGEGKRELRILRRELWDVRVQLMAEDGHGDVGLGRDDVKTGVYEGGFKSWESSVDLVRVLMGKDGEGKMVVPGRVLEMGCGTALPTLAIFQQHLSDSKESSQSPGISLTFADYNPTVLQLVTLPNVLLSWVRHQDNNTWADEGELEITPSLLTNFQTSLESQKITLNFLSGAWSPEFVSLFQNLDHPSLSTEKGGNEEPVLILAAETIYSPLALQSFTSSLMEILKGEGEEGKSFALVAAKKVYFGVGGSMEDFYEKVRELGGGVREIREEVDGVRRAVAEVRLRKDF